MREKARPFASVNVNKEVMRNPDFIYKQVRNPDVTNPD